MADGSHPANSDLPSLGDRVETRGGRGRVIASDRGSLTVSLDSGTTTVVLADHPMVRRLSPWDEGRVSPPWQEIDAGRLTPALTPGERDLASFLDKQLDPSWRIYVRPHLDAERPLLAAVHPTIGGMIWDVVDWDPETIEIQGKVWIIRDNMGERRVASPLDYLDSIRNKLYGVYLPEVGERLADDQSRFGLVRAGLYWPRATTGDLLERFGKSPIVVFGHDSLRASRLSDVIPRTTGNYMEPAWFEQFDRVLGHHFRMPDPMSALRPTKAQERHVMPHPGIERLEGIAGSGKSVVLAYRAARIASQGRRVLIITYNTTLTNYIRALLDRVPVPRRPELVSVVHYHELLKRIFDDHAQWPDRAPSRSGVDDDQDEFLNEAWPRKALELLDSLGVPERLQFDAILIDEGQDFSVEYLEVIRRLVRAKQDPEVVIAYDPAQRIYSRTPGAGMAGSWTATARLAKLREGVRLPSALAAAATAFAQHWQLATDPIPARPEGLLPESGGAWWCQADSDVEAGAAALEILARWRLEEGFRAGRCAILVPSKQFGWALVRLLNESGISVNHVFPVRSGDGLLDSVMDEDGNKPDWLVSQQRKRAFSYHDSRVKVSTIHSFKGWDAERVIHVLPRSASPDARTLAVTYVGITRSDAYAVFVGGRDVLGLSQLGLPQLELHPNEPVKLRFGELLRTADTKLRTKGRPPTDSRASDPPWPTM